MSALKCSSRVWKSFMVAWRIGSVTSSCNAARAWFSCVKIQNMVPNRTWFLRLSIGMIRSDEIYWILFLEKTTFDFSILIFQVQLSFFLLLRPKNNFEFNQKFSTCRNQNSARKKNEFLNRSNFFWKPKKWSNQNLTNNLDILESWQYRLYYIALLKKRISHGIHISMALR